jgi:Xaa-Pro aminopeptidase
MTGDIVDAICRDYFASINLGAYFTHGLGHGVGLDIHELPVLSPRSNGVLCENMIVTVEPGLYIEKFGGVRIEDSVLVKTNGCEILTHTTKNLLEI